MPAALGYQLNVTVEYVLLVFCRAVDVNILFHFLYKFYWMYLHYINNIAASEMNIFCVLEVREVGI